MMNLRSRSGHICTQMIPSTCVIYFGLGLGEGDLDFSSSHIWLCFLFRRRMFEEQDVSEPLLWSAKIKLEVISNSENLASSLALHKLPPRDGNLIRVARKKTNLKGTTEL